MQFSGHLSVGSGQRTVFFKRVFHLRPSDAIIVVTIFRPILGMGQCSNREVYGLDNEQRDQEIMSVIAYLYYYADMNQADIADRLFLSRSTVSRLIKKARQNGVVELRINEPWQRDLPLEDELKTAFGINGARVLKESPETDAEGLLVLLSRMTAYCISCSMQKHTIVGMSWGNTISHVCCSLEHFKCSIHVTICFEI